MSSCHSVQECYDLFSGVKLSVRFFLSSKELPADTVIQSRSTDWTNILLMYTRFMVSNPKRLSFLLCIVL